MTDRSGKSFRGPLSDQEMLIIWTEKAGVQMLPRGKPLIHVA
jgi:hypothetical protein